MQRFDLKSSVLASFFLVAIASPASANLSVAFDEGAPKDQFSFTNTGNCDISDVVLTVDLSGSKAGLIFDVTGSGAGVEVFQPYELVSGESVVVGQPTVVDGDTKLDLKLTKLAPQKTVSFTIDVDDTAGAREITVSDEEILGAKVILRNADGDFEGKFTTGPNATVNLPNC